MRKTKRGPFLWNTMYSSAKTNCTNTNRLLELQNSCIIAHLDSALNTWSAEDIHFMYDIVQILCNLPVHSEVQDSHELNLHEV